MKAALTLAAALIAGVAGVAQAQTPLLEKASFQEDAASPFIVAENLDVAYKVGGQLPKQAKKIVDFDQYRLEAPPKGAYYARIGGDVVLVRENNQRIVQVVSMVLRVN